MFYSLRQVGRPSIHERNVARVCCVCLFVLVVMVVPAEERSNVDLATSLSTPSLSPNECGTTAAGIFDFFRACFFWHMIGMSSHGGHCARSCVA